MIYRLEGKGFWLDEAADAFLAYLEKRGVGGDRAITVAAGMTPSCPIHFGIFREIAISHFMAEELKRRGKDVRLVFYWDDFDHFCKVPYFSSKKEVGEYVGKPLTEVPDPDGKYPSYGAHYMRVFEEGLEHIGISPEYDYQSKKYDSGSYSEYIRKAIRKRREIFDIVNGEKPERGGEKERDREGYFPLEVYCAACRRDTVTVRDYDEASDELDYECRTCGYSGKYSIGRDFSGKLMWKANWAARWRDDCVLFESSGENQLTQTGSYAVSSRIVSEIFEGSAPFSLLYRFIGMPGVAKVSRALGEKSLSSRMTDLLEPAIIRWLMLKNPPDKPFAVDLENGLERIYHEWDQFMAKNQGGAADDTERRIFSLAVRGVPHCPIPIPFKAMLIAIGVSNGDLTKAALALRKICRYPRSAEELMQKARPRIDCALSYVFKYGNRNEAPMLLAEMDSKAFRGLSRGCREAMRELAGGLPSCATEDEVSALLGRVPGSSLGASVGKGPQAALRKEFYKALYQLLIGKEKGPKLSTLIHMAGSAAVLRLIKGEAIYEHIKYRVG
jgi:lysyl-tRNA synthetase, class I